METDSPRRSPAGMPRPGWYADPSGAGMRWWDGTTWTPATSRPPVARKARNPSVVALLVAAGAFAVSALLMMSRYDPSGKTTRDPAWFRITLAMLFLVQIGAVVAAVVFGVTRGRGRGRSGGR